ncbi:MAG: NYN domain-containing protein, partial [Rubrobacteraceae bacterium]
MALILDGYNLIGALDRYRAAGTLDGARDLLINDALKAAGWTGRPLIVVFDAHRGHEHVKAELRAGGAVRVMYSAPGVSADDVIERLLSRLE